MPKKTARQTQFDQFIARVKESGGNVLTFSCPHCAETNETQAPEDGSEWSTLSDCYHCSQMFMKLVTKTEVKALLPSRKAS